MHQARGKIVWGTVLSAQRRGRSLLIRLRFDGDDEPQEYTSAPANAEYFAPGKRVPMARETKRAGRRRKATITKVRRAVHKLGGRATQKAVAEELNVNASTLHRLQARVGKSWEELKTMLDS